jgi:tRNA pseudouridine55 synthase
MSRRRNKGNPVHGWINLDKPQGLTSMQALGKVRRILDANKAGHAGTLDPLATGILPIALGEATKIIPYVQDNDKTYSFTVTWGAATDTDDREGAVIETSLHQPSEADIREAIPSFIGHIKQTPPQYSAIKIDGQRAYDLARAGENPEMKSRIVEIHSLTLLAHRGTESDFRTQCGKGTYIRAIARDIARQLGTCGHIAALRREAVGHFTLENAISLEQLENLAHSAALDKALHPLETPLDDIPALDLKSDEVARLKNGQALSFVSRIDWNRLPEQHQSKTILARFGNQAIALVERNGADIKPVRVFNL